MVEAVALRAMMSIVAIAIALLLIAFGVRGLRSGSSCLPAWPHVTGTLIERKVIRRCFALRDRGNCYELRVLYSYPFHRQRLESRSASFNPVNVRSCTRESLESSFPEWRPESDVTVYLCPDDTQGDLVVLDPDFSAYYRQKYWRSIVAGALTLGALGTVLTLP